MKPIDPLSTPVYEARQRYLKDERRVERIARAKFIVSTMLRDPLYAIAMIAEPMLGKLHGAAADLVHQREEAEIERAAIQVIERERLERARQAERRTKHEAHRNHLMQHGLKIKRVK